MYIGLHVKGPLFLSDFNEIWISSTDFGKIRAWNLIKIHSVGAELFHAGARKYRQEDAHSRFSQFCGRALNKKGKTESETSMNHHVVCCASAIWDSKQPRPTFLNCKEN